MQSNPQNQMASNLASDQLLWHATRKHNSFVVKRKTGGKKAYFSRHPSNLMNLHSYKFSGIAQSKTVGVNSPVVVTEKVEEQEDKKKVVLSVKQVCYKISLIFEFENPKISHKNFFFRTEKISF